MICFFYHFFCRLFGQFLCRSVVFPGRSFVGWTCKFTVLALWFMNVKWKVGWIDLDTPPRDIGGVRGRQMFYSGEFSSAYVTLRLLCSWQQRPVWKYRTWTMVKWRSWRRELLMGNSFLLCFLMLWMWGGRVRRLHNVAHVHWPLVHEVLCLCASSKILYMRFSPLLSGTCAHLGYWIGSCSIFQQNPIYPIINFTCCIKVAIGQKEKKKNNNIITNFHM